MEKKLNKFDKFLEELIWKSLGMHFSVNKLIKIGEEYKNISLLLYQKGDPEDRYTFNRKRNKFWHSIPYNFENLLNEVIDGFERKGEWFSSRVSPAVFCIGLRNNDEKLMKSAAEEMEHYYTQFREKWCEILSKIIEKVVEFDKDFKRGGKLIELLWDNLTVIDLFLKDLMEIDQNKFREFLKLFIEYEKDLENKGKFSKKFFEVLKIKNYETLKSLIDLDKEVNGKGEILENVVEKSSFEVYEEEDKINMLQLIKDYDEKVGRRRKILKKAVRKILSYGGYDKDILKFVIDFEREINEKGETIKEIIENSYPSWEDKNEKIEILKLIMDYEKECRGDYQLVESFISENAYKEFLPLIIEYDRENKKNGKLVESFAREFWNWSDVDFVLIKNIIDYDIELSNNFYIFKTFLRHIPPEKIPNLKEVYQKIIQYDRELKHKFKLTNILANILIAKIMGLEEDIEWETEKEIQIEEKNQVKAEKKDFDEILKEFEKIKDSFYYKEEELEEIYKGLFKSDRHFVILSGPPGTGKTAIAILIVASYLGIEFPTEKVKIKELIDRILKSELFKKHVALLRTKPEWTSPKDVIGYRDINGNFHKGAIYDLLENASKNKDREFFIIIDEMNLSHPEHYLSDIISAMETGGTIETDNESLEYHGNIYIIGTINDDETTQNLSPRLLSRAYEIEMRVDWEKVKEVEENNKAILLLEEIDKELKKIGYGFGYRDIEECKNIVKDFVKDIDIFLKNKLIPKLRGSDELNEVIKNLIEITERERLSKTKELLKGKFEELKRKGFI